MKNANLLYTCSFLLQSRNKNCCNSCPETFGSSSSCSYLLKSSKLRFLIQPGIDVTVDDLIRGKVTINSSILDDKVLYKIGSNTLLMSYVHVAHDCVVGNHCILVSFVGIAGETVVDDWAIVGGGAKAHQFSKIGCHAMVGGMSKINKDIPPYVLCGRDPICYSGVNIVGLRRRGFSSDVIRNIKDIYDTIYFAGYNITDGCAKVEAGFPQSEERDTILNFIRSSKRGIIRANDSHEKGEFE